MEVISPYKKLDESRSEIRLLEIFPSIEEDETLKLQLHTVSPKDDPKYTALSYVWGDPAITENVILNGKIITIGANLASAMRHLQTFAVSPEESYRGEARPDSFSSLGGCDLHQPTRYSRAKQSGPTHGEYLSVSGDCDLLARSW